MKTQVDVLAYPSSSVRLEPEVDARTGVVERSEWVFALSATLLVLALTSLPYLFAYWTAPADKQFMGIVLNIPDHMQYFSWFREFMTANLSANKLTPEANQPVFFNLLWWSMGKLGAFFTVGYAVVYQAMRWLSAILFMLLVYRMLSWFFVDTLRRKTAFLLVLLGSGFGWVLVLMKYTVTNGELLWPLDVYVAEPNTFLSILGSPHFVAAALYMFVFDLLLRGQAKASLRYAIYAGLFALFMGWQHAYDLIIVYGVIFAYALLLLLRDRKLPMYVVWSGLIVGIISVWPALYSVMLTSLDPLWEEVLAQFANAGVYTPPLYRLPILLGIPFLLALFTVLRQNPFRLNGVSDNALFLRGWFWISFVLIYLPVDYQIHMLNGWQVPIAILATQGLFDYVAPAMSRWADRRDWRWSAQRGQVLLAALLIAAVIPTNLYLLAWRFVDLRRYDYPYFLHKDEIAAMHWLESRPDGEEIVLASLALGQYVPAETGKHAFLAHWAQTVDFYGKTDMVEAFYSADTPDEERTRIIDDYGVDYVLVGPAERAIGSYAFEGSPRFTSVFATPQITIYAPQSAEE